MIIIEGPRQSGKKTLADKLALEFNLPVYDYSEQLKAQGHINITEIKNDIRQWGKKPIGIYVTHPLINEYIYGPLLRKQGMAEFYHFNVRALIEYLQTGSLILYCRPSITLEDPATPFFDLIFRTPLSSFRVWEYDYTKEGSLEQLHPSLEFYISQAQLKVQQQKKGRFKGA